MSSLAYSKKMSAQSVQPFGRLKATYINRNTGVKPYRNPTYSNMAMFCFII